MRRILVIVLILLVVVVGLFFLAAANVNRYHDGIQAQIQKKLNRPVTLGHLGLRLLPLSVSVAGLTVAEDSAFKSPRPFATADNVFISVGLFSLLRGNVAVNDLTLGQPKIELIRNASGTWNYSSLGLADHSQTSSSSDFTLGQLKVVDGQIAYTDLMAKEPRAVYDHIDVDLRNFGPHKQFDLALDAHLPGQGKQLLSFKGKVGPLSSGSSATPINGHLTAEELTLSSLNRLTPGLVPKDDDGVATVSTDVSTEGQRILLKGDLKLDNAVLQGKKLGYPISSRYDLVDDRSTNVIQVKPSSVGLGQTSFNVNGTANTGTKPGTVNMHVVTHDSSIEELAKLAAAAGVATDTAYQVKGVLSADVTATGPTSGPQLSGTLDARTLNISGGEIKQPVTIPAIHLALSPQAIQSNPFDAHSGSTSLNAQFALSQYQTPNRAIDAILKTNNANIAELLDMAKAYGFDSSKGASASGRLTLDVHAQGPLSNTSALNVAGNAQVTDAQISSPSLNKPVAVHSANVQFARNSVSISNLRSTVGATGITGNLTAKNFSAPQVQFALAADKIDTADLQNLTKPSTAPVNSRQHTAASSNGESLIDQTTGSGTLSANAIQAQSILLTNVRATCKLNRGLIELSPVTADLFGGKEAGTISINTKPIRPVFNVKSKLSGLDSNALLSSLSSVHDTLYGRLTADANLGFTLETATADLAKTLNGTLAFDVADGKLKNVNILNEISRVGKFLNSSPAQASGTGTDLKRLSGTLNIQDGLASSNNLTAALSAGSLSANGSINLVTQGLDLHMNAVLNSGTSQSVGGSGIGGYLNTALANNKGELVLPVLVTGSTAHPIITPDIQALARMKLNNLLPTSGDPTRLTSGIVGAIAGKQGASGILNQVLGGGQQKQDGKGASNTQNNDPINSILQQFGKKKPK